MARFLGLLLLCVLAAGCGGGGDGGSSDGSPAARSPITVWIAETEPDRVAAMRRILAAFTGKTGVKATLDVVSEEDFPDRVAQGARDGTLPDVIQLPMASAHAYAREGILDADAAQDVVDELGEETFSARALQPAHQRGPRRRPCPATAGASC